MSFYDNATSNQAAGEAKEAKPGGCLLTGADPDQPRRDGSNNSDSVRHPRLAAEKTNVLYDHGTDDGIPVTLDQVYKLHGPDAVDQARSALDSYANPETKMLMKTDLGNDPGTISRIVSFTKDADRKMQELIKEESSGKSFYDNSPTMVKGRVKNFRQEISDNLNRLVQIELKQRYIELNDVLEMV